MQSTKIVQLFFIPYNKECVPERSAYPAPGVSFRTLLPFHGLRKSPLRIARSGNFVEKSFAGPVGIPGKNRYLCELNKFG